MPVTVHTRDLLLWAVHGLVCVGAYAALRCFTTCGLRVAPLTTVEAFSDLGTVIMEVSVIQLRVDDQPLLDHLML